jgi:hypothetical protein
MDAISSGTVAKLAKTVYTRIDGAKVLEKQCAILKARVKRLEQVVLKAKPHAGVEDLVREMERILQEAIAFIDEEEKRGWLKRVAVSKKTKLQELVQRLDEAMSQLSAEAVLDMAANQKEMEAAAREDNRMLQERLTRMEEAAGGGGGGGGAALGDELRLKPGREHIDFDKPTLGEGVFAEVRAGTYEFGSGQEEVVAYKIFKRSLHLDAQLRSQIITEAKVGHRLTHPNLIRVRINNPRFLFCPSD